MGNNNITIEIISIIFVPLCSFFVAMSCDRKREFPYHPTKAHLDPALVGR